MKTPIEKSLDELLFSAPCYKTGVCRNANCKHAVGKLPETGRWFITFGHCGFNSKLNNTYGYASKASAMAAMRKYLKR